MSVRWLNGPAKTNPNPHRNERLRFLAKFSFEGMDTHGITQRIERPMIIKKQRNSSRIPILILGAGPTGLGAAIQAEEREADWLLLEAADSAGGLATSFVDEVGFTWDLGSHLQFSHYERYDQLLDEALAPDEWLWHKRSTWIQIDNHWIPYPLQCNLHRLPPSQRWACMRGLLCATKRTAQSPRHFADWIRQTFGEGIAETFLLPYNRKIWTCEPESMSHRWIAERVAVPNLESVLENLCLERDETTWGPNATFRYPRKGGTGGLWRAVAAQLPQERICYGERVVAIDSERRIASTQSGKQIHYDLLISTIPLDRLTVAMNWETGKRQSRQLVRTRTRVTGIGLTGNPPEQLRDKCWIYHADPAIPFYRVTVLSNLSPETTAQPGRQWSLMVESAHAPDHSISPADGIQGIITGLRSVGYIRDEDRIVSRWQKLLSHGYPVPSLDRDQRLEQLLPELQDQGIYSRGRFGAWKYEVSNQDHSFMQGVEAVERILSGTSELTLFQPDLVNSRHNPFPYQEWSDTFQLQTQQVT